jgi:hypothetical protein
MTSRPGSFRQADLARVLRTAVKEGVEIGRIEIDASGKIVVTALKALEADGAGPAPNLALLAGGRDWRR